MLYISQKLGPGVKDSVLKYHNDTTIRLGDICEKQRLSVAETYSSSLANTDHYSGREKVPNFAEQI